MALCAGHEGRRFCTNPVLNDGMICDRCWVEREHKPAVESRPVADLPDDLSGMVEYRDAEGRKIDVDVKQEPR